MESSDDETTDSGALGPAYSLTDMLDELGSESTSGVTSPVPSEDLNSPAHEPTTTSLSSTTTTTSHTITTATLTTTTTSDITTSPSTDTITTPTTTSDTTTAAQTETPPGGATCNADKRPHRQGQSEVTATSDGGDTGVSSGSLIDGTALTGEGQSEGGAQPNKLDCSGDAGAQTYENDRDVTVVGGECTGVKAASDTGGNGVQCTDKMKTKVGCTQNSVSNGGNKGMYSDMNGNAKTVAGENTTPNSTHAKDVPSDKGSDELVDSKNDPIWKRKKVIKRRKPKPCLNRQSSTGSAESEGSTSSVLSGKGLSPEREIPASDIACDNNSSLNGKNEVENGANQVTTDNDVKDYVDSGNSTADTKSATGGTGTETGSTSTGTSSTVPGNGTTGTATAAIRRGEIDEYSGYETYEFRPLVAQPSKPGTGEDIYANVPDSALYENITQRTSDPRRSTLRRGATLKGLSQEDLVSMTYQGCAKLVKVLPDQHHTSSDSLTDAAERTLSESHSQDGIYESLSLTRAPLSPLSPRDDDYDDFSWGSSEFESYDEEELPQDGGQEPISVTVEIKSRAAQEPTNQNVLNKLAARIGPRSWLREDEPDSSTYLEVTLNMDKHPPPTLPPMPSDLTPQQVKRRHIVASIVESEKSYTDSLRRIIEEYEKPLLLAKPQVISKNNIKVIFYRLRDILQCHNMFHIELAENIRVWDTQEKLGNVFTASFSKSMVFDVYSEFVNNFTLAMETAKKLAKQKQTFADFLKQKIQNSSDKLSLFGLMVKPVQRFPQFILCLQDLLKHTSREHHDRLALQLALTELETLTHKLNEMKRESENKHEVKKIQSSMTGNRFSFRQDHNRCLVRQDDMVQMDCNAAKSKPRRLFLMNDQLVCTTVVQKPLKSPAERDSDTGLAEKFKFKWSIPIRDVEVVESEMPDLYQVQGVPGRSLIVAPKLDRSTFSPWKKELDDMMHDLAIVEQVTNLTSQLRLSYTGLSTDLLFTIQRSLQHSIQDQGDLDLCILHFSLPTKFLQTSTDKIKEEMSKHIPHKTRTTRASRMLHTFQVQSASIKQDWLLDLKNAKLSLDPNNKPGWYVPETDQGHRTRLPLFVKPLLIDITKQDTKIQCAIPVVLPSYTNPYIGIQHLWVCSNESRRGQVTVVKLHSNQPHVLESFTACDSAIVCAEYIPGFSTGFHHDHAFPQDTVWMAMESNELCVRNVVEEERGVEPLLVMDTDCDVTYLRFMDSRLYAGLADGRLAIYSRDRDGVWQIEDRLLVELGVSGIAGLLTLNHQMWVACDNKVHVVQVTARWRAGSIQHHVKTTDHEVGSSDEEVLCIVKAGVGLMVSFKGHGVIRIYNQETFNHLQDVNIASAVTQILEGRGLGDLRIQPRQVAITFMLASKGLLWVGTDSGCTLTLPLPRLEGVPQIKGRPSVSYHAHLGPIKFIVPIHCGPCQLHVLPTSPMSNQIQVVENDSQSDRVSEMDGEETEGAPVGNGPGAVIIKGATMSDTNDSFEGEEVVVEEEMVMDDSEDHSLLSELSQQKEGVDYLSASMLHLPQSQATLSRTKWTSTPELRHASAVNLNDSEEDVIHLYNNLLRGADYEHYDFELMGNGGRRKRRPQSDMGGYPSMVLDEDQRLGGPQQRGMIGSRTNRHGSKCATLPILKEDSPAGLGGTYREAPELQLEGEPHGSLLDSPLTTTESGAGSGGNISPGLRDVMPEPTVDSPHSPPPMCSPNINSHTPLSPVQSTMNRLSPSQKSLSKSVVIVTGGEGHINWAEQNPGDNRYDDICLLLWQCRI